MKKSVMMTIGQLLFLAGVFALLQAPSSTRPKAAFTAFGSSGNGAPPSIPSFASNNTKIGFFESFSSLNNIDLAQTVPAGKNWYTTNRASFSSGGTCSPGLSASDPAWYTVATGALTISSNATTCQGLETSSFGWKSANTVVNNFVIPGSAGFYSEVYAKWTPNCAQAFVPDAWMQDLNGTVGQLQGTTTSRFGEVDLFEDCCSVSCGPGGNGSTVQTVLDWTNWNANGFVRSNANLTDTDYTQYNQWGALVTTMAQGGGTGSVKWYRNRVQTGSALTWSSTSDFGASIETSNFILNFSAGNVVPLSIKYWVVFVP